MKMNTRRAIASLLAAGAAASTLSFAAVPASADETVYKFIPTRLECIDFEDYWPDWKDEINLFYEDVNYWNDNMHAGARAYDLPSVTFTGNRIEFQLWEWDRGTPNNDLGTEYAYTDVLGQQQTLEFVGDGWHYRLYGRVVKVP